MTSQVDPKKLQSLLKGSQAASQSDDDDDGADSAASETSSADAGEDDDTDDEEGDEEEVTVESLTEALKSAVPTINEIIDEFRTGSGAQPKAGVEQLETELDADTVHGMCRWTEEAGKKDFRKLGEALDVEDVDGFVGWMRAVRKQQEEEGGEEGGGEEGGGQGGEENVAGGGGEGGGEDGSGQQGDQEGA
jgi:hypothetical protein